MAGLRIPENFLYYLSMHMGCSEPLLHRAERLTPEDIELSPNPEVVRVRKMVNSVLADIYRMRAFVRLKPLGDRVLYGYLKPKHKTGSDICRFFALRSPYTIIVLGNSLESWISLYAEEILSSSNGRAMEQTLEELSGVLGNAERDNDIGAIWKVYYSSQYSPERRNLRAFHRRMPRTVLGSACLEVERNKNGLTLEDFFGRG